MSELVEPGREGVGPEVRGPEVLVDDLGHPIRLSEPPARVVSLVPSLTEALAQSCPDRLVGATEWCTHPAELDVPRVRGTKNPDLAAVAALGPDLVVANKEENRELDVRRLRERGIAVWVTDIETVDQALGSMSRLFHDALRIEDPAWLADAREEWATPGLGGVGRRVATVIWRDPWMVVGAPTYTSDLLARVGCVNPFAAESSRYPQVSLERLDHCEIDLVLLPDEPYVFTTSDGPEAFVQVATSLVSGRRLTWYGPAMVGARAELAAAVGVG